MNQFDFDLDITVSGTSISVQACAVRLLHVDYNVPALASQTLNAGDKLWLTKDTDSALKWVVQSNNIPSLSLIYGQVYGILVAFNEGGVITSYKTLMATKEAPFASGEVNKNRLNELAANDAKSARAVTNILASLITQTQPDPADVAKLQAHIAAQAAIRAQLVS